MAFNQSKSLQPIGWWFKASWTTIIELLAMEEMDHQD
jgi:hypothetical protein